MYGLYVNGGVIAEFVAPMSIINNKPDFSSDTLSLKRFNTTRAAQRWELSTYLKPLSNTFVEEFFLQMAISGYTAKHQIIMPQLWGSRTKRKSGSFTVSGNQNSTSLSVSNTNAFIPKGSFVRVGNHSKIYVTMTDRDGGGSVTIYPPLKTSASSQQLFWQDDVVMECWLNRDSISGIRFVDGLLADNGMVNFVEAV